MSPARHEFGHASSVTADSVGEPGHRFFRLLVGASVGSACLWLDKEQLYALALAIHRVLGEHEESGTRDVPDDAEAGPPASSTVEFKVGNLALGRSSETDLISVMAYDEETDDEESPTLRWWGTHQEFQELADEALKVCSSGRPRCPLCHGPMDEEGHICPKSNGHHSMDIEA